MINRHHHAKPIIDTPHKKIKPNEESTLEHSPSAKPPKESFLSKLKKGAHGSNHKTNHCQKVEVSSFELPLEYRKSQESVGDRMEEEHREEEPAVPFSMNRKFTCVFQNEPQEEAIHELHLYRNSSTCDQARQTKEIKLGDNIYLRPVHCKTNVQATRISRPNQQNRLRIEQDYEIEQNLKLHSRHHASYICLNKLERIFYYVKKISMDWEQYNNYDFLQKIASQQIKIYNSDPDSHFLRFYQSWVQSNALYLTFQVAIESLEDTTFSRSRLREIEVWDLLRDCCSGLKWLTQTHELSHLNIKPGNIIKCQRKFKLVDPYCTKNVLQIYLEKEGQQWNGWNYMAPEIKHYSCLLEGLDFGQADIYSLGMCVIENLVGERYFPREGRALRVYLQKHLHGYSPSLVRTLMNMVSSDPRKRPRGEEICMMQSGDLGKKNKVRRFSI